MRGCLQPVVKVELAMERGVGLGMNMVASTHGPKNDQKCLAVNALRDRADGSPGPAEKAGVKIGDLLVTVNGFVITDFASLKRAVGNSKIVTLQLERQVQFEDQHNYDGYYPEIVLLQVTRASPKEKMGAALSEVHEHGHSSYYDDDEETHVVVKNVSVGPLQRAGLKAHDVFLSINDHNVATLKQVSSLTEGKTDIEFVVKRMTPSQNVEGRRENKTYTFDINVSDELDLGLNLKAIKSGLGDKSSDSYLYVKDFREYPNGDPGPGLIAGVRQYDLLLKLNGMEIYTVADVRRAIEGEETVQCEVRRMIHQFGASHDKQQSASNEAIVVVTRAPGESLGLSLVEAYGPEFIDPFLVVTKVRSGGPGERSGIKVRDIIWQVEEQDIFQVGDIKDIISGLEKFKITIRRNC